MYYDDLDTMLFAFAGILIVFVLIAMAVGIAMYVFRGIGFSTIAKNRGMKNPWLIWIPVAGSYAVGAVADDINAREGGKSYYRFLLLGGNIITMLFGQTYMTYVPLLEGLMSGYVDEYQLMEAATASSALSSISSLISLGVVIVELIALNKIFKCYKPESSTGWTVLCIFFGFLRAIFPFAIRHNQPMWTTTPPQQGGYQQDFNNQQPPYQQQPPQDGGYQQPYNQPQDNSYQQPNDDRFPPQQ